MKTVFFLISLLTFSAFGETYYLDPVSGNNENNGTSAGTAWETIVYAEANAEDGSTVYLMDGDYSGNDIDRDVTRTGWEDGIVFTPADGASPNVIDMTIGSTNASDYYIEFSGLSFTYNDTGSRHDVIHITKGNYIKFTDCTITGKVDAEDADHCSEDNISLEGTDTDNPSYITISGCDISIGYKGAGVRAQDVGAGIEISDNTIHNISHAGVKLAGETVDGEPVVISGNEIYEQDPLFGDHGAGIYIAASNVTISKNIIRAWGNTALIQSYTAVRDGRMRWRGTGTWEDDEDHMVAEEAFTQDVSGAKGWFVKEGYDSTNGGYWVEIFRNQAENIFVSDQDFVSDTNPNRVYQATSAYIVHDAYGGYKNLTIENNLFYDPYNQTNSVIFYDISDNFTFVNNTIIGCTTSRTAYLYFEYGPKFLDFNPAVDGSTVVIANNIFVSQTNVAEPFLRETYLPTDITFTNNLIYCYSTTEDSPSVKTQDWIDTNLAGNTVYCESTTDRTGEATFTTSGSFFVGSSAFDLYSYTRTEGVTLPHKQDLGNAYAPATGSDALNYGDTAYAPATDILGVERDATPSAGCYEEVGTYESETTVNYPGWF